MATILDVAREAGVSPSTVSRVINNSLVVSDAKRKRVLEAIEKVGYDLPTANKDRTGKLILVVSDVPTNMFNDLLYRAIGQRGYQMILFHYCEGTHTEQDLYDFLQTMAPTQKIAGIVLCNFVRPIGDELRSCLNLYPVVQIGCRCPLDRTISVDINEFQAAYDGITLLLERGCRKPALLYPGQTDPTGPDRFYSRAQRNGARAAMLDMGRSPDDLLLVETDFMVESVQDTIRELYVEGGPKPDALMMPVDSLAMGCLRALWLMGVPVPERVKILALHDEWVSAVTTPSVSTLAFPYDQITAEATRILFALIEGVSMEGQTVMLPYRFELRESTGD